MSAAASPPPPPPSSSSSSSLDRFPQDIIAEMLLRLLPAGTLLDLRRVCKSWSSLILSLSLAAKRLGLRLLRFEPHQNLHLLHLPRVPHYWPLSSHDADFCSILCSDPVSGSFGLCAKFANPFDEHALALHRVRRLCQRAHLRVAAPQESEIWTIQSMNLWNPAMRKLRDLVDNFHCLNYGRTRQFSLSQKLAYS